VGVITYDRDEPRSPHLEYEHLFDMGLTLLTAADHPLARKRKILPQDVVRHPLILTPPDTPDRIILERLRQRYQFNERLHVAMEVSTFDLIGKYVGLGIGIALVYLGAETGRALPGLRLRVFDPSLEGLPVALVVRKGAHLSEPTREFCRLVCRFLRKENTRPGKD
jgi:DNA-binding transcriptional LysR family regulator